MLKPGRIHSAAGDRIGAVALLAYVLPSLALAAVGMPLVVHLPQFYASREIGLSLAVTGLVFGLLRLLDVFIDPVAGYVSDQWRTRFGRRRPMMAVGAPLLAIGIWMVFVPGGTVTPMHLGFWLFVMYLGWSMTTIPHLSWGSELSGEYHERSRIYGWSQAAVVTGMVGILVLPAILEHVGIGQHSVQIMWMAVLSIAMLVPSVLWCVSRVPEPPVTLKTRAGFLPTLKFLLRNGAMRRVIAVDFFESLNQGARGVTFFYFVGVALAVPQAANTLLLIYFVMGVACIPIWIALSRRVGKHRALISAYIYGLCVGPLVLFVPAGNVWAIGFVLALSGATYGAPAFLIRSMMADVADADAAENSTERAGLMYSFLALTSKFGIGLAALALPALGFIGFDPRAENFSPDVAGNLRIFYVAIPMVLHVVSLSLVAGYPIGEREQRELRQQIERRRVLGVSVEETTVDIVVSAESGSAGVSTTETSG